MDCSMPRPPCPSPSPGACSNSCPLSWWCHPTISSSVIPFSYYLQSSQHQGLFKWVSSLHQVSKVLELQLQHQSLQWIYRTAYFRIDWLISLQSKGVLRVFNITVQKYQFFSCLGFFMVQLSLPGMTTGKTIALIKWTFVGQVISLLFNMLFRFFIPFLKNILNIIYCKRKLG